MGEKKQTKAEPRQALYRRYRSTSFDEVVGQEHITELLKEAVSSGAISHAYLFTGQKGTGKTSVARILAYAINQLPYHKDAQHLDIIEIDAASNRRIDDIRDLREKVHIAPVSAAYKVYIIDEVHMLTGESFNALLKTLEEPPAHAIFILATTELHKVPGTIISRTQRFHFRPVATAKVVAHLKEIAQKESITIDEAALELIAEHGGGSFRDSIGLLDQLGSLNSHVSAELVESILGRAGTQAVHDIVLALQTGSTAEIQSKLTTLSAGGVSPVTLAEQITRNILREPSLSREWYELAESLMNVPKAYFPQLLLTTTLLRFGTPERALAPQAPPSTPPVPPAQPVAAAAPVKSAPLPSTPPKKPAAANAPLSEKIETTTAAPTKSTGVFDWESVLSAAKKTNAPLHSILAKARVDNDGAKVTLHFQYALHRKRLEQPAYRTQVARLIEDVCGINPEIIVESGEPALKKDETSKKVADIMGGGESITV